MAGVLGVMPETLFSFTFRELMAYSEGVELVREREEIQRRKIAYIIAKSNTEKNASMSWFDEFWPMKGIKKRKAFKSKEEMLNHKKKLMQKWQIHSLLR
jgi:hypothetical protein